MRSILCSLCASLASALDSIDLCRSSTSRGLSDPTEGMILQLIHALVDPSANSELESLSFALEFSSRYRNASEREVNHVQATSLRSSPTSTSITINGRTPCPASHTCTRVVAAWQSQKEAELV
jgi:hypothetical protein